MVRYVETLTNDFRTLALGHSPDQVYVELKQSIEDDEFAFFSLTLHLPDCCAYLGAFFETAVDAVIPEEFTEDGYIDVDLEGSHDIGVDLHPEFSIETHVRSNVRESSDDQPEWFVKAVESGYFTVEGPNDGTYLH